MSNIPLSLFSPFRPLAHSPSRQLGFVMLTLVSDVGGSAPTSRRPVRVLSPRSALPLQTRPQELANTSPRARRPQRSRERASSAKMHPLRASWSSGWEIRMEGEEVRRRRSGRRRLREVDSVIFRLGREAGGVAQ